MKKQNEEDKIESALMRVADAGWEVYERIRKVVNYTDGKHKEFTAEIAALNVVQNACGKAIMHRALTTRAAAITVQPATGQLVSQS